MNFDIVYVNLLSNFLPRKYISINIFDEERERPCINIKHQIGLNREKEERVLMK